MTCACRLTGLPPRAAVIVGFEKCLVSGTVISCLSESFGATCEEAIGSITKGYGPVWHGNAAMVHRCDLQASSQRDNAGMIDWWMASLIILVTFRSGPTTWFVCTLSTAREPKRVFWAAWQLCDVWRTRKECMLSSVCAHLKCEEFEDNLKKAGRHSWLECLWNTYRSTWTIQGRSCPAKILFAKRWATAISPHGKICVSKPVVLFWVEKTISRQACCFIVLVGSIGAALLWLRGWSSSMQWTQTMPLICSWRHVLLSILGKKGHTFCGHWRLGRKGDCLCVTLSSKRSRKLRQRRRDQSVQCPCDQSVWPLPRNSLQWSGMFWRSVQRTIPPIVSMSFDFDPMWEEIITGQTDETERSVSISTQCGKKSHAEHWHWSADQKKAGPRWCRMTVPGLQSFHVLWRFTFCSYSNKRFLLCCHGSQ